MAAKKAKAKAAPAMTKGTFAFTTDLPTVQKQIKSIGQRVRSLDHDIPIVMASVMVIAIESNNCEPATFLYEALAKGYGRAGAAKRAMAERAPMIWVPAEDRNGKKIPARFQIDTARIDEAKAKLAADREKVIASLLKPFWIDNPDPEDKPFNLPALAAALLKRAEAVAKDEKKRAKADLSGMEILRQIAKAGKATEAEVGAAMASAM